MKLNGNGGSSTKTGSIFEQKTDLCNMFMSNPIYVVKDKKLYDKDGLVGYFMQKMELYRFLKEKGFFWKNYISKRLLPDEMFYNVRKNVFCVVEKKFQQKNGSVDEKPQTCAFKLLEYNKLLKDFNAEIKFCYLFNDWFKDEKYKDMLDYIIQSNCQYFFNEIPVNFFL